MTGFDWVIIAIFIVSIIIGMMRGFVREALSIASWIIALWLAVTYCSAAGNFIAQYINIPAEAFRIAAGFALIFIITLIIFSIISSLLGKLTSNDAVQGVDRLLGMAFGLLRGVAIVAIATVAIRGLGMNNADWWNNSSLIKHFDPAANYLESVLPEQLKSKMKDTTAESTGINAIISDKIDAAVEKVSGK